MSKQIRAQLKNLDIAPRKTRVVADIFRGMPVGDAEAELTFRKERAATALLKLLKSAAANAKNQGLNMDNLVVKTILVNKGMRLKRWLPRAQGRATPIYKDRSHVLLILEESQQKTGRFRFIGSTKKEVKSTKTSKKSVVKKLSVKKSTDEEEAKSEVVEKPSFFRRTFRRKTI